MSYLHHLRLWRVTRHRGRRWPATFFALVLAAALIAPAATGAPVSAPRPLAAAGWDDASTVDGLTTTATSSDVVYSPIDGYALTAPTTETTFKAALGFKGSMETVTAVTGAQAYWDAGYTGAGVDVALIDSGVVPVNGLTYPGKVINAADLSFESQADNLRYLDTYAHGTHLAGIIAGRDDGSPISYRGTDAAPFLGMAPGARIVNVKVADREGSVDVSQVIAAIDWVVQHRTDNGMNIKVLALAYGTDGTQDYTSDPLAFAVEQAWKAGIAVVVSAGNDGNRALLRNPAYDPFVIAVGAYDGGSYLSSSDDVVAAFSNCGTKSRHVDLVAPGKSILSLRNPGSQADIENPSAVVAGRYFLGSGTSQAAAVVAGAAALVIDQHPRISPEELKLLLTGSARSMASAPQVCQGAGELDLGAALSARPSKTRSSAWESKGSGTLEGARGSIHLQADGVVLAGEQDIFGTAFDAKKWAELSAAGSSWSGGTWNGSSWSGSSWSGSSWSGSSWSGSSWSGSSWSGSSWSGSSWSGSSWSGNSWSGSSWSGSSWSGSSWSGSSWSASSWSGLSWE